MVKGGDSYSEGFEFKSWYRILYGHCFTLICCKISIVCLKKTKIKQKDAEDGPFLTLNK